MSLPIGQTFADRYRVEALLGEGGMGTVYRAHDLTLDRKVALKVVRSAGHHGCEESRARMLREARSAAALHHPNAVSIFDVGDRDGTTFIAMELVDGSNLRTYVGDRSISIERRVAWLRDIARALAAAHARGLVHRDIKPENVVVAVGDTVKVLDFGIARRVHSPVDPHGPTQQPISVVTGAGVVIGTPFYMAPEQMRGELVDARADVFAWGVLAFELLSGELPWGTDGDSLKMVAKMFTREPPSVRGLSLEVPDHVDAVIRRAMEREQERRPASMADVLDALGEPSTLAVAPTAAAPVVSSRPRPRMRLAVIAALAGAVALSTLALLGLSRSTTSSRHPASEAPSSGATTSSPATHGVALTDLPAPQTTPEALVAYMEGLRALRAGSDESAIPPLQKAVELDPTLAQAHMRLTRLTAAFGTDPRPSLARTLQLRGRLSPRDQDLFDALRPLSEGETHDFGAAQAAMDRLVQKYPDDAEIAYARGDAYLQAGSLAGVIQSAQRALDLDPEYGDAASLLDLALGLTGRFDEEQALAERCVTRWSSIDCGINDLQARSYVGDVGGTRRMAERALRIDPTALNLALYEASALIASGEPVAAARAVLDPVRARLPGYAVKARIDAPLAALAGDLGAAARYLGEALELSPRTRVARGQIVKELIEIDEEMGRRADAQRVAQVYVSESAGYTKTEGRDWTTFVLHELVVTGAASREQLDRERDRVLGSADGGRPAGGTAEQWATYFGSLATTREDAVAAVAALSLYGTPAFLGYHFNGGLVGRARFLAGDVDGALADLERGAREVRALFGPRDLVRASLLLGEALEAKGEHAGACTAFDAVLGRWGSATPRSVSAEEARRHRAAMSCPREARE